MVRSYYSTYSYPFSWDFVVSGFWKRYPNPSSNHIVSEDVIKREITPEGNLRTTKLIVKRGQLSGAYSWAYRFFPGKKISSTMQILEESIVNPNQKVMKVKTLNFSKKWRRILGVLETIVFRQDPENNLHTLEKRRAIFSSSTYGCRSLFEKFGYEKYRRNIILTKDGFLDKLKTLYGQKV